MLLEPLLHRDRGTFVCVRCRVRSVEDADFIEENNRDATSFALADFCTESDQKRFDVLPSDVRAGGVGEQRLYGLLMRTLRGQMVPQEGTARAGCILQQGALQVLWMRSVAWCNE